MTFFDTSLSFAPVAEQNNDPVLPEERLIFELIGLERSEPDQFRKAGGVKWTWRVFYENGQPFVFNDEQYQFFRTTGINANGTPLCNIGTNAHEWASAMLGRQLGVDDTLNVAELHGKRMSAMVVWEKSRMDAKKKTVKLASLRHVKVSGSRRPDPTVLSEEPSDEDVDRALVVQQIKKRVTRLSGLDKAAGADAQKAIDASDLSGAPLDDLRALSAELQAAIAKAAED